METRNDSTTIKYNVEAKSITWVGAGGQTVTLTLEQAIAFAQDLQRMLNALLYDPKLRRVGLCAPLATEEADAY